MAGGKTRFLFWSDKPDYQDAAEKFNRAGNLFKTVKAWRESGEAFFEAAKCDKMNGEPEEAARKLISAASCFKKIEPARAIDAFVEAITVFLHAGRFHLAASYEKEVAELYESLDDAKNSMDYYARAAERYSAEDSKATALGCQLKAGNLAAVVEEYGRAAEIFMEIIQAWAGDELKRYSIKDYFTRHGLCLLLSGDLVGAKREIEAYPSIDHNMSSTSEYKLLMGVLSALEENDLEKFDEEVGAFNSVGLLDDWRTKMLLRLKQTITDEDESLA
jgi:alpha-soluble NSF attachment protein